MQDYNIAFMKVNLYRKYKENISRKKPSEFNSDKKIIDWVKDLNGHTIK